MICSRHSSEVFQLHAFLEGLRLYMTLLWSHTICQKLLKIPLEIWSFTWMELTVLKAWMFVPDGSQMLWKKGGIHRHLPLSRLEIWWMVTFITRRKILRNLIKYQSRWHSYPIMRCNVLYADALSASRQLILISLSGSL